MNHINLILCVFMFGYTFGSETLVKSKMEESGIVPDVIDEAPNAYLKVKYTSDVEAQLGNELSLNEVKFFPNLDWNADENANYTILMTDPDAPPPLKEFRHWLIVNIPGNDVSKGKIILHYLLPTPPIGTGLHRYILLVFEQRNIIETNTFDAISSMEGRVGTKTRDLIKKFNLGPIKAGNFFLARFSKPI